jgi:hypothetical protein
MLDSITWNTLLIINPEFAWGYWAKARKMSVRTGGNPAKIRIGYFPNIHLDRCRFLDLLYTCLIEMSPHLSLEFKNDNYIFKHKTVFTHVWLITAVREHSQSFPIIVSSVTLEIVYCFKHLRTSVVANGRCLIHTRGTGRKYDPNRTVVCRGWKLNVFKRVTGT